MATVSTIQVNELFDEHMVKYPNLQELAIELKTLYVTSLWHQMTDNLMKYVENQAFDLTQNTDLIEFYNKLIKGLSHRLNPMKYALITISCSR